MNEWRAFGPLHVHSQPSFPLFKRGINETDVCSCQSGIVEQAATQRFNGYVIQSFERA